MRDKQKRSLGGKLALGTIKHVSQLVPGMSKPLTNFHMSFKNLYLKLLRETHFRGDPSTGYSGEFQDFICDKKSMKLKISEDFSFKSDISGLELQLEHLTTFSSSLPSPTHLENVDNNTWTRGDMCRFKVPGVAPGTGNPIHLLSLPLNCTSVSFILSIFEILTCELGPSRP